jgi:DNA-binding CsgD family transcriptional regulator
VQALEQGRKAYARRAWVDAYSSLNAADGVEVLEPADLELLATSAYMLGRDAEWRQIVERAHHGYLEAGDVLHAARSAFWIGMNLALAGEMGPATGWLGRAQRLVDGADMDCVERGYLLLPRMLELHGAGDFEAAAALASEAAEIGRRFGDSDLFALAVHAQGETLAHQGRVREGLGLLDEAMVAVTTGEVSPVVTGIVYCSVILVCQAVFDLRRAREWTEALTRWCDEQPDLLAFTGRCRVHRAEIMQMSGSWSDALEEARRATARLEQAMNRAAAAQAAYREGEVQRLVGNLAAAEEAYRESSRHGWEPQPGLSLLRLAQGNGEAALAGIRRAAAEATEPLRRASLLPAYVEITLASGELDEARAACDELEKISDTYDSGMLTALAAQSRGAVELAGGDAREGLPALRRASQLWEELEVPFELARTRVDIGLACRALGDDDGAALELEAAGLVFEELGATPELTRVEALAGGSAHRGRHGLSSRELEVLRLVAAGSSNRQIASELVISEHTVARHVQNIFMKLGVSSRAAAGAFAFKHDLV